MYQGRKTASKQEEKGGGLGREAATCTAQLCLPDPSRLLKSRNLAGFSTPCYFPHGVLSLHDPMKKVPETHQPAKKNAALQIGGFVTDSKRNGPPPPPSISGDKVESKDQSLREIRTLISSWREDSSQAPPPPSLPK